MTKPISPLEVIKSVNYFITIFTNLHFFTIRTEAQSIRIKFTGIMTKPTSPLEVIKSVNYFITIFTNLHFFTSSNISLNHSCIPLESFNAYVIT